MAEAGWEMAADGAANTRAKRKAGRTVLFFMEFPRFRVNLVLERFLFKGVWWRFVRMLSNPCIKERFKDGARGSGARTAGQRSGAFLL
jgi:hypothetical protein